MPKLFEGYTDRDCVFVYSSAEDPNVCQLTMHKPWTHLVFAWLKEDAVYVFKFPKDALRDLNLTVNHADGKMQDINMLFKQAIRFKAEQMNELSEFLIDIVEQEG